MGRVDLAVRLDASGQLTFPKVIRDVLDVDAGDLIRCRTTNDGAVVIMRLPKPKRPPAS